MPMYKDSKFEGDFISIGHYNIENIKKHILHSLDKFTITNKNLNNTDNIVRHSRTHNNTNHITFFFEDNVKIPRKINLYNPNIFSLIENDIKNILKIVQTYYQNDNLIIARCLVTCLKPLSDIPIHRDGGYILELGHRIHIPIITNNKVHFTVGHTTKVLEAGNIF